MKEIPYSEVKLGNVFVFDSAKYFKVRHCGQFYNVNLETLEITNHILHQTMVMLLEDKLFIMESKD